MRYSLKQLQVFLKVAHYQNISKAALDLAMSQSAVSSSLSDFEGHYGIQCFDRNGKKLQLNELGRALRPQALALFEQAQAFEQLLQQQNTIPVDLVAKCLSIPQGAIVTQNHLPQNASVGRSFVMIELVDLATLAKAAPVAAAYQLARDTHGGPENRFSTYLYVKTPKGVQARMFSPLTNTPEDPATGSAAAALGAYLTAVNGQAQTLEINQGIEMGRPSLIHISTSIKNNQPASVTVGGAAVKTMQGRFTF